jgi:hypothetical protein
VASEQFVGASAVNTGTGTSATLSYPAGLQPGHTLIAVISIGVGSSVTPTAATWPASGNAWTALKAGNSALSGTITNRGEMRYRVFSAGDATTNQTITLAQTGAWACVTIAYSGGVASGSAFTDTSSALTTGRASSTSVTAPDETNIGAGLGDGPQFWTVGAVTSSDPAGSSTVTMTGQAAPWVSRASGGISTSPTASIALFDTNGPVGFNVVDTLALTSSPTSVAVPFECTLFAAGPTLSRHGTAGHVNGAGVSSIDFGVLAAGDVALLYIGVGSSSNNVASISGGGPATWTRIAGIFTDNASTPFNHEIWMGVSTGTGTTVATLTFASAIGSTFVEIAPLLVTPSHPVRWSAHAAGTLNNASSTTLTWPNMTALSPEGEIYFGHIRAEGDAGTANGNCTSPGFTTKYESGWPSGDAEYIYKLGEISTIQPVDSCSTASTSHSIAVLVGWEYGKNMMVGQAVRRASSF